MQLSKKENILLLLSGISFLILFAICSWFNRFAVDDYYHIHIEKIYGIWGGMVQGYYNWGGRWTSYLIWNCVFHFHEYPAVLILYSFSIIVFFILSVFLLLQRILEIRGTNEQKNSVLGIATFFSAFVFFISFSKGEIWFWVVATAMYIESICFFILLVSLIMSKSRKFHIYLLIIISSIFAGGASEMYALSYIIFLLLILFAIFYYSSNSIIVKLKSRSLNEIIIALIFLIAAFMISVTAPGNQIRTSWLPEPSFLNAFYISFKELGKLIIFKFTLQLPWMLLFSIPFMYFGFLHGKTEEKRPLKKIISPFLSSLFLLVILFYFLLFPSCYILSEIGPDRSLSLIIFIVAVFIALWSYYIGKKSIKNLFVLRTGFIVSMILLIALIITFCIIQFNTLSKYAAALDERNSILKNFQKKGNTKTITVSKLPPSGYLYSAEISSDTNYFGNEHYQSGIFLDFKVNIPKNTQQETDQ